MDQRQRRAAYVSLWVLALAFGWIEASAVVYLREIGVPALPRQPTIVTGLPATLIALPEHLVALEMAREACTIVLLGAVAWLAGSRPADRAGSFLLAFGIWDLTYYGALALVLGWPDTLRAWDVLFLIPAPWVAPVWAPITAATLFILGGTYLFWTSGRARCYRWLDAGVLATAVLLLIVSFLSESTSAVEHRVPERFPAWLFWIGIVVGSAWFVVVERRSRGSTVDREPWVGVRVRTILPEAPRAKSTLSEGVTVEGLDSREAGELDIGSVIWEYMRATRRLDALLNNARETGERLERLARGLSDHPARLIIGSAAQRVDDESEWDVVPSNPLPQMESLARLTADIREAAARVEELRDRLILRGRGDVVDARGEFFH